MVREWERLATIPLSCEELEVHSFTVVAKCFFALSNLFFFGGGLFIFVGGRKRIDSFTFEPLTDLD